MLDLIIERTGDVIEAAIPQGLGLQLRAVAGNWLQLKEADGKCRISVHDRDFERLLAALEDLMDSDRASGSPPGAADAVTATRRGSIRIACLTKDLPSALAAEMAAAMDEYLDDYPKQATDDGTAAH